MINLCYVFITSLSHNELITEMSVNKQYNRQPKTNKLNHFQCFIYQKEPINNSWLTFGSNILLRSPPRKFAALVLLKKSNLQLSYYFSQMLSQCKIQFRMSVHIMQCSCLEEIYRPSRTKQCIYCKTYTALYSPESSLKFQ